jgi:hypothetical protein
MLRFHGDEAAVPARFGDVAVGMCSQPLGAAEPVLDSLPRHSCGSGLGVDSGSRVTLQTQPVHTWGTSCDRITASIASGVSALTLGESRDIGPALIDPYVQAGYPKSAVSAGEYRFGLNSGQHGMLGYQYFIATTSSGCAAANVDLAEDGWCWDSWRVQVTDSKGARRRLELGVVMPVMLRSSRSNRSVSLCALLLLSYAPQGCSDDAEGDAGSMPPDDQKPSALTDSQPGALCDWSNAQQGVTTSSSAAITA